LERYRSRSVEKKVPVPNWFFLDLGCGEGAIARAVFDKPRTGRCRVIWGLDNDKEMVKKAKKSRMYKKVLLADAGKIPLDDGVVDLVFSNSVLEHIKEIDKVLSEINRVLKPGGRLVFTVPSNKLGEYLGWGRLYAFIFNKKYNHYHLYDLPRWKKILGGHGLKIVKSKSYLSKEDVRHWHKLLWQQKLGLKSKNFTGYEPVRLGAGLAVVARKKIV